MSDRRYRDAEWLREQYVERERSTTDIAEECGVSAPTISRWLNRHGIETRDRSAAQGLPADSPLRDAEWLREQYVENGRSMADIAGECGVIDSTVRSWLDRHGIETRDMGLPTDSPLRDGDWLREQYVEHERVMRDIAEECGVTDKTVWEWLDRHGIPTREEHPSGEDHPAYRHGNSAGESDD